MSIEYWKKNYTQGHLRTLIQTRYVSWRTCREIQLELGIWSTRTVAKRGIWRDLESKSSAPNTPSRKYSYDDIIKLYCIRKYLGLSLDDCIEELERTYWVIIKRSSSYYYLRHRECFKKEKRKTKKFKEYDPWYVHIDISYWPKIDGKKQYIYVAIDRATRLIYIEIHENKKAETAAIFLKKAIEFFPFEIEKILTDNGKEFTLKNHLWKVDLEWAFDTVCKEFEIEHRLTKPRHPRTNGMVEKSNDTIKSNTVGIHIYDKKEDMVKDIIQFMFFYNLHRRHWGIVREKKWKTPYDALLYYHKIMPQIFTKTPKQFIEQLTETAKAKNMRILTFWYK